ncbi:MAG: hypothetical protein ACN0LA_03840 [Candidatus Longimicrobiales bacterium M2_2A_002]
MQLRHSDGTPVNPLDALDLLEARMSVARGFATVARSYPHSGAHLGVVVDNLLTGLCDDFDEAVAVIREHYGREPAE